MYLADIFTVSANLAGLPGVSVPCGLTSNGLPIGLQFLGRPWDEATILKCAAGFGKALANDAQRSWSVMCDRFQRVAARARHSCAARGQS